MRIILMLITAAFALSAAACGDDDDGDATPTSPAATATAARSPSPAPTAPSPATPAATAESAITIDAPADGATLNVPFTVSGAANVFEAVLFVQVLGGGSVLCERRVMATSGTGTPGTWETTMAFSFTGLTVDPTGSQAATVRAFSRSARDGAEENAVTREVQLSNAAPDIVIDSPRCGDSFAADEPLEVSGRARVFEAALSVDLRDTAGAIVATQNVTAGEAGPAFAPWAATFNLAGVAPGAYELVAYSLSAQDGSVENVFAIPIEVAP